MNQIYLFEIFMDQLIFMEDIESTEIVANITSGNILDIYVLLMKNVILTDTEKIPPNPIAHKFYKGGKSVFFSSSPEKVIEAFETNMILTISAPEPKQEFGTAKLRWNDKFRKEVIELTENIKNIRYIDQFEIVSSEEKKIAKIDLNMLLLCYGETIEMSIANVMSSAHSIPIMIPKYGNAKQTGKRSTPANDPWSSLFNSPHKEKHSIIDVDLMLYAQMAGIVTDEILESKRLTVDYINDHLCGHKSCPGAVRFRDWGIGPLASPGSGLGTIGSLNETKTNGMYGMSQAYGTLAPYGAYGLFVNTSKPTKAKCNSPVCPFTNPDEVEEERLIGQSMDEALEESCCVQNKNKAVKCTCKCCGKKYVKKFPSTCEDPLCPSVPKKRVYKCKGPICPHTAPNNPSRIDCTGEECPAFKEDDPTCEGKICPYSAGNIKKCCVTESCPKETAKRLRGGADDMSSLINYKKCKCCNKLMKRKPKLTNAQKRKVGGADDCDPACINADGSYIYEYGAASTRNWRSQSNLPNSCNDPNCNFNHLQDSEEGEEGPINTIADLDDFTTTDSSWGKPAPQTPRKCTTFSPETCIIKKCKVDPEGKRHDYEITKSSGADAKIERLTRLVNEASQNIVVSGGKKNFDPAAITKNLLNTKHLLSDVVSFEDDDDEMIYLIARLLGQREFSHSMNNFYMDEYFSECRLKERNDQAVKQINVNDETCLAFQHASKNNQGKVKQKRRGPCQKDTCQYMKYKTCSECGGISKSGATCDNSDVSFSYISYSDIAEESIEESGERQDRKLNTPNDAKNMMGNNKHQTITNSKTTTDRNKHVDIKQKRRRKNRFIYNCGETYPGIRLGHKYCRINDRSKNNVPYDMGWLWSIKPEGIKRRRKNWKPGMINTTINDRIIEYRKKRGIPDPPQLKMIVPTKKKDKGIDDNESESSEEEIEPKPTLIIQKKEGSYLITMNPLKDPKTLAPHENPYMSCKPMQFIITRPKPPPKKDAHRLSGEGGEGEESAYEAMYEDECFCNKDDDENKCVSSSSSESELNIEFTTPAGLMYPEEMKKPPNVIHTSTQFKEADFNCTDCVTILPKKFSKRGKKNQKKK